MNLLYHKLINIFLLLVSTLCGVKSFSSSHLSNTQMKSQYREFQHTLFKRDEDSHGHQALQDECGEMIFSKACENGFFQDYVDLLEECHEHDEAKALQDGCRSKPNGKYCGSMDIFAMRRNIEKNCNISDPTSCHATCKSSLNTIRSDLGCCLKIYNDSTPPFSYKLWSACDTEPVTQECSESTVKLSKRKIDQTCDGIWSPNFLQKLYSSVICKKKNLESIDFKLQTSKSCQDMFRASINSICRANELGMHCNAELSSFAKATMASASCYKIFTCDPLCANALQDISNTVGCCFNHEYNDSSNGRVMFEWMSHSFWTMCGLEPLGTCDAQFTSHAILLEPTKRVILIFTIIMNLLYI